MPKIRFGIGGVLMLAAMLISDSGVLVLIYAFAAALHEAGHLVAAKMLGIGIDEIAFGFSGIRIVTEGRLTSYKKEFLLAAAGPFMNILTFLFSLFVFSRKYVGFESMIEAGSRLLSSGEGDKYSYLAFFALSALVQAIVNLLPVKSFDGGRMLYCLTAELFGEGGAERIVGITTAFSVFILWTVALYLMLRASSGLGIYVFAACIFTGAVTSGEKDRRV